MFINVGYKYPSVYSDELTDPIRYDRPTSTLTDTLILPVIAHLAIIFVIFLFLSHSRYLFHLSHRLAFLQLFCTHQAQKQSDLTELNRIYILQRFKDKIPFLSPHDLFYITLDSKKKYHLTFFPFYSLLAFYCLETHYKSSNLTRSSAKVKSEHSAVKLSLQHINWLTLSPQSLLNLRQELYFNDGQLCCWSLPEAVSRSMGKLLFPSHPLKEKKGYWWDSAVKQEK